MENRATGLRGLQNASLHARREGFGEKEAGQDDTLIILSVSDPLSKTNALWFKYTFLSIMLKPLINYQLFAYIFYCFFKWVT